MGNKWNQPSVTVTNKYLSDSPLAGQARLRHTAGAQLCSRSSRATGAQWGQGDDVSSLSISTCWKDVIGICLFYSSYPRWRHSNKHCQFWYLSYNFLCVFFCWMFLLVKKWPCTLYIFNACNKLHVFRFSSLSPHRSFRGAAWFKPPGSSGGPPERRTPEEKSSASVLGDLGWWVRWWFGTSLVGTL